MNSVPLLDSLAPNQVVLILSAHCDDAEIGCGGLLKRLARERKDCHVREIVFSGGNDPVRRHEEESAAKAFGIQDTTFCSYPDSLLPNFWHEIKRDLLKVREEIGRAQIGMILCPRLDDRHQDHRIIAENAWRVFRDHLILEYEIHKFEGDWGQPNLYVTLTESQAHEKAALLLEYYPSRTCHFWWSQDTFLALMRLRGMEANYAYAEGLIARKMRF